MGELGFFQSVLETVQQVLLQPGETFEHVKPDGYFVPSLFLVGFTLFFGLITLGYQVLMQLFLDSMGVVTQPPPEEMLFGYTGGMFLQITLGLIQLVIGSILVVGLTFLKAGLIHVVLMMTGATRYGYETTYRICAYAWGATQVVYLVPCFGGLLAMIWSIVVATIGIDRGQDVGTGRALGAVLVPYLLCCGAIILVAVGIVAAIGALGEGQFNFTTP
jgi:hypothetical protein